MKYILTFLAVILFTACTKENVTQKEIPQPVLIKVEAEHSNGEVIYSPIILVR